MTKTQRRQHWQAIFQQWRDSGLPKNRFCSEHNITLSNFYRWQKILSHDEQPPSAFIALKPRSGLASTDCISLTLGALQLQVPAHHLGQALAQLKMAGLIHA